MDIQKLFETLSECVAKSVDSPGVEVVKMHNIEVPVITAEAKKHEKELRKLLLDYPEPRTFGQRALIYRSWSRSGFAANCFHSFCRWKGPKILDCYNS